MSDTDRDNMRLLLAARLSRKAGKYQGIGIETQDEYGRRWAESQGHTIVGVAADVKSGRVQPWDRPNLRPWVTDPAKMAQYDGILAYKNDRLSRGKWDDEVRIRQWASDNGKVLVIVDGPQWPPRNDGDFWSWTAQAKQAEKEWLEIQERNLRFQGKLRQDGKLVGAPCFGYDIAGEMYDKTLVPNAIGRRYVPQMFQRIADGQPLSQVAKWVNEEGITDKPWPAKRVSQLIHNRTYMGQRMDREGRRVVLTVEPLVDAKLWKRANDRLANSPVGRRGPVTGKPALLSGVLFCNRCLAPMYRSINTPSKSNGKRYVFVYYRCVGHYPERKGCGNMIHLDAADIAVTRLLSLSDDPWKEPRLVEGENHDIELTAIKLELDDLSKRNLPDIEEDAERSRLRAERDRLESLPRVSDRWDQVEICDTCGGSEYKNTCEAAEHHKVTVGEHWASLDHAGRRAMLLGDVKVSAEELQEPELRKASAGPLLRIESRLFKIPVTWLESGESEPEAT